MWNLSQFVPKMSSQLPVVVTSDNFFAVLPVVKAAIARCDGAHDPRARPSSGTNSLRALFPRV